MPAAGTLRACDEAETRQEALELCNRSLAPLDAAARVRWALEHLPGNHVLSSSFGAQAAVMLHLVTREAPGIPVVLVDTGYLFPETYRFVDELTERLDLNLSVYRAEHSPAWQEARHGQRWLEGKSGIEAYNDEVKVQPMKRALRELSARTWFSGLRRTQSRGRASQDFLQWAGERSKVHPIVDWTDRDVYNYLKQHGLPYHPLWHEGYVSIGDTHSTLPLSEVENEEQTRFAGVKRECGLHEFDLASV